MHFDPMKQRESQIMLVSIVGRWDDLQAEVADSLLLETSYDVDGVAPVTARGVSQPEPSELICMSH